MATVLPYNRAYDSWQNLPSIATPFTAQAMNTIEDGVENNRNYIIALEENFLSVVPTGETTLSLLQGMDTDTERHFFTDVALADFPTTDNHVWYLEIYKTSSQNLAFSNIILRDKTDGKSYVGTAGQSAVTWVEVGSGEGNASYLELTQAEYDALTPAEKNNGTIYFITDPTPSSVPSTIMASNVLYNGSSTLDVDNVSDAVDDLATRTENLADFESTTVASKPYLVGDLFLENNALKKATQPIAQGGDITGSNSEDTTVGKEISRINSNLSESLFSKLGYKILEYETPNTTFSGTQHLFTVSNLPDNVTNAYVIAANLGGYALPYIGSSTSFMAISGFAYDTSKNLRVIHSENWGSTTNKIKVLIAYK